MPLSLLIRYDLRTDQYLKTNSCPVHIIHGTKDHLIPFRQSEALQKLYPESITLHPVVGAQHNNLPDFPAFFELLYDILYVVPQGVIPKVQSNSGE